VVTSDAFILIEISRRIKIEEAELRGVTIWVNMAFIR
jgi:hypothetical protein